MELKEIKKYFEENLDGELEETLGNTLKYHYKGGVIKIEWNKSIAISGRCKDTCDKIKVRLDVPLNSEADLKEILSITYKGQRLIDAFDERIDERVEVERLTNEFKTKALEIANIYRKIIEDYKSTQPPELYKALEVAGDSYFTTKSCPKIKVGEYKIYFHEWYNNGLLQGSQIHEISGPSCEEEEIPETEFCIIYNDFSELKEVIYIEIITTFMGMLDGACIKLDEEESYGILTKIGELSDISDKLSGLEDR